MTSKIAYSLPQNFPNFLKHLANDIYCPYNIQMFIVRNNFAVNHLDMRLSASIKAAEKLLPID
ncbi:hypothetical protein RRF57_003777 [Xylaria bambusicola]|uniref:Uncharacterized protein n=1 Tax=Xylaria bambusicola TaxID=326684 RepID=A0AAN7UGY9_9PEZI